MNITCTSFGEYIILNLRIVILSVKFTVLRTALLVLAYNIFSENEIIFLYCRPARITKNCIL